MRKEAVHQHKQEEIEIETDTVVTIAPEVTKIQDNSENFKRCHRQDPAFQDIWDYLDATLLPEERARADFYCVNNG